MNTFRNILALVLINLIGQVYAQTPFLKEIRISTGQFRTLCGKCRVYHDIQFRNELEYNITDSTFYYHKKISKRLKKVALKGNDFFDNRETQFKLDSIADNFTDYKRWGEKYSVYKIDLIYYNHHGLPHKVKTMIL